MTFRIIRDSQIRTTLLRAILANQIHRESQQMRGLQRLSEVTKSVLTDMDDEAGAVADELLAAKADSQTVIAGFKAFVGEIKANTAQVRDVLAQLTNGGPAGPLPDIAGSPGAAPLA